MGTLTASGDWGLVSEPPQSNDKGVLSDTPNIILNTNLFSAFTFTPQSIAMGGEGGYGPFTVSVTLSQVSSGTSRTPPAICCTLAAWRGNGAGPMLVWQCNPPSPCRPCPEQRMERACDS